MKMLHDLSRLFTPKPSAPQESPAERESLQRTGDSRGTKMPDEEGRTRKALRSPSDAAQQLWCRAQHF
jgi:hypothetical protein